MTAGTEPLTGRPAWKALKAHYDGVRDVHLRKLFAGPALVLSADPSRNSAYPLRLHRLRPAVEPFGSTA